MTQRFKASWNHFVITIMLFALICAHALTHCSRCSTQLPTPDCTCFLKNELLCKWRIQDFPEGWKGSANQLFDHFFQKLHENEKSWPGGEAIDRPIHAIDVYWKVYMYNSNPEHYYWASEDCCGLDTNQYSLDTDHILSHSLPVTQLL